MKFIFYALIFLLPNFSVYAQENLKPLVVVEGTDINFKYRLIKIWTKSDHKQLIESLKINGNSLPLETMIVSDSSITDKNDNLVHSWSVALHRPLASMKVDLKEEYKVIENHGGISYGKVSGESCSTFNANLDTTDYLLKGKEQQSNKLGSLLQSQLSIEDNYIVPITAKDCESNPIIKIGIDYMLFTDNSEVIIKIKNAALNKKNNLNFIEVFSVGKKEQLILMNPNIFKKDTNGKISYLNYLFYINLDN